MQIRNVSAHDDNATAEPPRSEENGNDNQDRITLNDNPNVGSSFPDASPNNRNCDSPCSSLHSASSAEYLYKTKRAIQTGFVVLQFVLKLTIWFKLIHIIDCINNWFKFSKLIKLKTFLQTYLVRKNGNRVDSNWCYPKNGRSCLKAILTTRHRKFDFLKTAFSFQIHPMSPDSGL